MNRSSAGPWVRFAMLVALVALVTASCGKNRAGTLLQPSGPKPMPAHPGGALYGRVHYESATFPDLGTPPFPPTLVTLLRNNVAVAVDSMAADRDTFRFDGIPAAYYTLQIESRVFNRDSIARTLRVVESPRLVDDQYLAANTSELNNVTIYVFGNIPGFGQAALDNSESLMLGTNLGVWTYPNDFAAPIQIPAGTYRFKFATDITDPRGSIGWGGDSSVVLTAPVIGARTRRNIGRAADIKMTFPTTGYYSFDLDERREVFSIRLMPPGARMASRRTR